MNLEYEEEKEATLVLHHRQNKENKNEAFPQRGKSNLSQLSSWVHRTERWLTSLMGKDSEKKKRGRQTSRKMYSEIIHGKLAPRWILSV